jgi:phospholipid/cholesterol/gamma-HCH transport system substrate-binding protein
LSMAFRTWKNINFDMNETRFAVKVGLFVALGIMLTAALLLIFSKGLNLFTRTYDLRLRSPTVGGLKSRASVLLNGVGVGTVAGTEVASDGRGVIILARVNKNYAIHADARFAIEQIGFLGDQYVAIYQQESKGPILQPGAEVPVEEPLNIEKTVRSATALLQRVDQTLKIFNEAVLRVDRTVLSERTLTNLAGALDNFRLVSDRAAQMAEHVGKLIDTNGPSVSISISNMVRFSEELDRLTHEVDQTFMTNGVELTKAVKTLGTTSHALQGLVSDVEAGKGLMGSLFKDEQLKLNFSRLTTDLAHTASNLNKYGLLYKPKQPKTEAVKPLNRGNSPFEK